MQQPQQQQHQQQQQARMHRKCPAGYCLLLLTQRVSLHQGLQRRLRQLLMLLQVQLLQATALCSSSSSRSSSLQWLQQLTLWVHRSSLPQLQLQQPSLTAALYPQ
jgi:hypothetical protein